MEYRLSFKQKLVIFFGIVVAVIITSYMGLIYSLPSRITIFDDQDYVYQLQSPLSLSFTPDRDGIISLQSQASNKYSIKVSKQISLKGENFDSVNLKMTLMGFIPLKTLHVDVVPNMKVMACGNTIGVKMNLDGLLVIGISDVTNDEGKRIQPTKGSGIKAGDTLIEINNKRITDIDFLINQIEKSNGNFVTIKYKHNEEIMTTRIKPEKSQDDKKYHIGIWVRESTAGIGTLTYYDPDTRNFGALGHGITDIDTGVLMPVINGEVVETSIISVKKGQKGNPGELKGVFVENGKVYGYIDKNCEYGIYGFLNKNELKDIPSNLYSIALKSEIKEGPAQILSCIEGNNLEFYNIEIQKISKKAQGTKGMVIKITDQRLLEKTGGIVQGMSGSPIIQNGKLIGAVTHVLVNDPTKGYGILIEQMIKNSLQCDASKENGTKAS